MPVSAAIVCTLRLPSLPASPSVLRSWLLFHLHKGFTAVYLFFDEPADPGIGRWARMVQVARDVDLGFLPTTSLLGQSAHGPA